MRHSANPASNNTGLNIPEPTKQKLKVLAKASGLTLKQYLDALIREAAENETTYRLMVQRRTP